MRRSFVRTAALISTLLASTTASALLAAAPAETASQPTAPLLASANDAAAAQPPGPATGNADAAPAPQPAASSNGLGEIVVTASRREQNLQDVGISVTAIGSKALTELGVKQTTDLVAQVPALKMRQNSPNITVFNIRGVSQNAFDDHLESPIAFYQDDAYVASATAVGIPTFDVARVEVLRGPQGTLFGRNATGGLIQVVSARPTKTLDGYLDITGGTRGHFSGEGAVGGPLTDWAQFRISGVYNYRDPILKNDLASGVGGQNNYAFRAQLALQPTDNLKVLFIGRYARDKNEKVGGGTFAAAYPNAEGLGEFVRPDQNPFGTCNGCDPLGYRAGPNPFSISEDQDANFNRRVYGGQGRVEWTLGGVTATSITDYQQLTKRQIEDDDGTPNPVLVGNEHQRYHQFSEEFRLSGKTDRFRWTAGAYYLNWRSKSDYVESSYALYGTPANPFVSAYHTNMPTKTWALYGQAEYDITRKLTFIGGLRYNVDKKTANYQLEDTFGDSLVFNPTTYPGLARENFKDYAARAQLNYKITPDILLYASFNRGIKGPAFSTPLFAPAVPENLPYKGETLLDYEAGIKSSFFNNRLRLNIGGFIYDYHDYQAYFYYNISSTIRNLPARAKGFEAELTALPVTGLTLSGGLSVMTSRVKGVVLPGGQTVDPHFPMAPGVSGNLVARYEAPVSERLKAAFQFDMSATGPFSFTLYPAPDTRQKAYSVGNMRVSLSDSNDRWNIALFSHNIWNQTYRVYAIDDASSVGDVISSYGERRWFGIELRYNLR
jgi:iron complex outermembrane receptor protein